MVEFDIVLDTWITNLKNELKLKLQYIIEMNLGQSSLKPKQTFTLLLFNLTSQTQRALFKIVK